jgi:pyruvate dehydrogenase E1 component
MPSADKPAARAIHPQAWSRVAPADSDPVETKEWLEAFRAVLETEGPERATFLIRKLLDEARAKRVPLPPVFNTPYCNTIGLADQPQYPGNLDVENRIAAAVRWNALAMVVRANRANPELGGHIATYASIADLFEVGFNHFFRGADGIPEGRGGDLVFFQPHAAPGVYARAFVEGRLDADRLDNYRREVGGRGLPSYCHPWLMPEFWQFPTGSMGLGPIQAIYQARMLRYLEDRSILATHGRRVWAFVGDGEMDEPESLAALSLAAREGLDNLVFVVNCNLQRLDGPVRGNGSIIQELEGLFAGAGWNVVKVLWGSDWDPLFARDTDNVILRRLHETVDGEFQKYAATDGHFNREHFFNRYPELQAIVAHLSDDDIDRLHRGGHDPVKIYAAYQAALTHPGQPTVVLAQTKKGYGMGHWAQGRMGAHQAKKLEDDALLAFRDNFALPLSDREVHDLVYFALPQDGPEMRYLHARRKALGGYLPARIVVAPKVAVPGIAAFGKLLDGTAARGAGEAASKAHEHSTTMVFVQFLTQLLRDPQLGRHIVPIVADEARTFGMQSLFRQVAIYSSAGQLYEPEDRDELLYYKEAVDGQILEEGINEAGAISSWIAAATSYSTHGVPMLPFYIYYSCFGFQRIADLIHAAADQRARGFLLGATAGRTTLSGEGLQHQDGTSHLWASTIPTCRAWDPCFGYELVVILCEGMRRMLDAQEDVFYYVTVMNENYVHPALADVPSNQPDGVTVEEGILRGMYLLRVRPKAQVQLLGSGTILREVAAAAETLEREHGIAANVWSVTSWTELRWDAMASGRPTEAVHEARGSGSIGANRGEAGTGAGAGATSMGAAGASAENWVRQCLAGTAGPVIAVTDYVSAVADLIRPAMPEGRRYVTLGTDGFGRSDTRASLRAFFGVDARHVVAAALDALDR